MSVQFNIPHSYVYTWIILNHHPTAKTSTFVITAYQSCTVKFDIINKLTFGLLVLFCNSYIGKHGQKSCFFTNKSAFSSNVKYIFDIWNVIWCHYPKTFRWLWLLSALHRHLLHLQGTTTPTVTFNLRPFFLRKCCNPVYDMCLIRHYCCTQNKCDYKTDTDHLDNVKGFVDLYFAIAMCVCCAHAPRRRRAVEVELSDISCAG